MLGGIHRLVSISRTTLAEISMRRTKDENHSNNTNNDGHSELQKVFPNFQNV